MISDFIAFASCSLIIMTTPAASGQMSTSQSAIVVLTTLHAGTEYYVQSEHKRRSNSVVVSLTAIMNTGTSRDPKGLLCNAVAEINDGRSKKFLFTKNKRNLESISNPETCDEVVGNAELGCRQLQRWEMVDA